VRDTLLLQLWLEEMPELKADGVQHFQEVIGQLWWAVEIGCVDILLETSLLSSYLAMPQVGHLKQAFHIFGYLKSHPKRKIGFDPSHPTTNKNRFQKCDREVLYRDASEAIPENKLRNLEEIACRHIVLSMKIMSLTRKRVGHKPISFCFVTRRRLCIQCWRRHQPSDRSSQQ
jgi:hypothetical protein